MGDWRTWLVMAGRGFRKTRMGSEWVREIAERGNGDTRIALVGGTIAEVRAVMVEGESGLLNVGRPADQPVWEPSVGKLTWPSGAQAMVFSAENPEKLRGPSHHFAWCDELAKWGYPTSKQHYLSGFARTPEDWPLIADAAAVGLARGVAANFLWALPQVMRDGFTYFDEGEADMEAFDDADFPLALGKDASVAPVFSTAVVTTASGYEQRNADWASARMSFDAGPGVRSEADISSLIAFFRARRGAAKGFRFRDPFDFSSKAMTGAPGALDQVIGVGDGVRTSFALTKTYGVGADAEVRRVTRPVAVSVLVAVAGVAKVAGWVLAAGGAVVFDVAPVAGAAVTAGFRFDVPVRFAEDRLEVSAARWLAGEVASVPLLEVRE